MSSIVITVLGKSKLVALLSCLWFISCVLSVSVSFSTVILSLPLIQEGQLSVSGEIFAHVLVNRLED